MGYFPEDHEVVDRLQREIGRTNQSHGFRDDWDLAAWLEKFAAPSEEHGALRVEVQEKLMACAKALRRNVIGMKIALAHSELSEMLEDLRDKDVDIDAEFADEGVDAIIRILDLLDMVTLPAGERLTAKMKANEGREHMHGRKA